ncbi:MAG: type 4a pilus biogenesis protein PilO [Gemmatimonadetes bacterium]|nr:type 4a pilus biogenesis protein PilO [Gemmatimonadota bacterium]
MPLLPVDPAQRRRALLLLGALILGGGYLYYQYVYSRFTAKVTEVEDHLETLQAHVDRARRLAQRYGPDLPSKVKFYERQLAALEQLIPKGEEVPELLDAIATQARITRVDLSKIKPAAVEEGVYYTRHQYEMGVVGEYHQVGQYLARIASLSRIIRPTRMTIAPAPAAARKEGSVAPVEASFLIETFVMGGSSAGAPAEAATSESE